MGYAEKHTLTLETDSSGDVTGRTPAVSGEIAQIVYTKDDFAAGVDFAITVDESGVGVWTESDVNASAVRAPLQPAHSQVGVALTYDGTRAVVVPIVLANERVKIVISSGGDTKSGTFDVFIK